MKSKQPCYLLSSPSVAPLAGAWIEIDHSKYANEYEKVAPLAGAWIEILHFGVKTSIWVVAPLAGAWIEMLFYVSSMA